MILNNTVQNTTFLLVFSVSIFFFIFLFTPLYATAQIIPELENVIILDVTPTNPGPYERVTISAESYSIDLNNTTISWFVNDVLKQQIIGGTSLQFTTGGLGSNTKIDVVAEGSGGVLESEQINIRPTDIDLLWQARTFTHPLYKGKSVASIGSSIDVEAVPHFINDAGRRLKTNELTYTWRVDKKVLPHASGRGKNTINLSQTKPIDSLLVEVEVESSDNILFGKHTILIPIRDSELLIYENNPLLGILFNKAVANLYSLIGQETKFIAYPFFMSLVDRNAPHIDYLWRLDGETIVLGEDRGSITVSHTGSEEGEVEISTSVQNSREIFQKSDSRFKIEFGKGSSSGFGF